MTVIQRRVDNATFYRDWEDYKNGFGNNSASFWIGLDVIHDLTSACPSGTRFEVRATRGSVTKQFGYSGFTVSSEQDNYLMNYTRYETAGEDSLRSNKGQMFSTRDRDNGDFDYNAATLLKSGWWHNMSSSKSNPNADINQIYWYSFNNDRISLDRIEMRIYW